MGGLLPQQLRSPIHLYRHLLREAGYLPPVCRPYITNRIQLRFRRNRDCAPEPDRHRYLRQANRDLRYLRAANAGDMPRMRHVLLLCFGRTGPRRRELVHDLVYPHDEDNRPPSAAAADSSESHSQSDKTEKVAGRPDHNGNAKDNDRQPRRPDFVDRWDTPRLLQFVKSQASTSLPYNPRPKIKGSGKFDPAFHLPAEGSSGAPLAPKVLRTKLQKGWKDMINRVLPPVEKGEWELLQALATGQAAPALWRVPARRPVAAGGGGGSPQQPWDWEGPAQIAVRQLERQRNRRFKLRSGETDDNPYGQGEPLHKHNYTPRFWQRTYAMLWGLTATMEKRQDKKNAWKISWGGAEFVVSDSSPEHKEFFDLAAVGADAKSAVKKSSRRRRPSASG